MSLIDERDVLARGWLRYEKARKLNPAQWADLHRRTLAGENFDDMIDALPAATPRPAAAPAEPSDDQMMAGYKVACDFGVYEARAFNLAERMWNEMQMQGGATAKPVEAATMASLRGIAVGALEGKSSEDVVEASRTDWTATGTPAIPEAPTPAMQQAGVATLRDPYYAGTDYARVVAIYKAMIAAASPSAPAGEAEAKPLPDYLKLVKADVARRFAHYHEVMGTAKAPPPASQSAITDEQILKVAAGGRQPWGIGSRRDDFIAAARAVLALASPAQAGEPTTVAALRSALQMAVRQNSHDMLMTGEEIRQCEAALATQAERPAGDAP